MFQHLANIFGMSNETTGSQFDVGDDYHININSTWHHPCETKAYRRTPDIYLRPSVVGMRSQRSMTISYGVRYYEYPRPRPPRPSSGVVIPVLPSFFDLLCTSPR